jgi:hypothetical protein
MKTNLVVRGIISPEAHFCVFGCGSVESAQPLYLSYITFDSLWALVRSWIAFSAVDSQNLSDQFVQFTYSVSGLRVRQSFMQLIGLAFFWVV